MLDIFLALCKSEPKYAYKRYAYKKTCMLNFSIIVTCFCILGWPIESFKKIL